jgi:hypothetical protein
MTDATYSHSMPPLDEGHSMPPLDEGHRPPLASPARRRRVFLLVGAAVVAIIVVGSVVWAASAARTMKSSVEGPDTPSGSVVYNEKYARFTMLTWNHYRSATGKFDAVLKLLILDNLSGYGHKNAGHSSSETDYSVDTGGPFENKNDFVYQYKAITWRNRTVVFSIDDALYDVDEGTVFLIRVENGDVEVQQIYADLSDVEPWSDSGGYGVQEFCETNEDVLAFLKELE